MKLVIESNLSRGDLEELSRILESAEALYLHGTMGEDLDSDDSWIELDSEKFSLNDTISESLAIINMKVLGSAIYNALKES